MSNKQKLASWYLADLREVQKSEDFPVGLIISWTITVRMLLEEIG